MIVPLLVVFIGVLLCWGVYWWRCLALVALKAVKELPVSAPVLLTRANSRQLKSSEMVDSAVKFGRFCALLHDGKFDG